MIAWTDQNYYRKENETHHCANGEIAPTGAIIASIYCKNKGNYETSCLSFTQDGFVVPQGYFAILSEKGSPWSETKWLLRKSI